MHIKTLTIQGFKSYRDQTSIEPFSPRHNVVVGRNGSGKSNFFAAIRFVLSDAYTSLQRDERQALLHEGTSTTTTLSAYVEIIFDNSDNRFPTGHDEVILRRTIGFKKDEYILDKKSGSKADVMNLLESAGFSRSNPYYIVPQGRITALTNAKDHERLALLKEVAGTKVYEQRRAESLRIMADTDTRRDKIVGLLEFIENRLTELEEEKEELKEFQDKDKERRCIEYALYQRELLDVDEALVSIEETRKNDVHATNVQRDEFKERETEIKTYKERIADARYALEASTTVRNDSQSELTELAGKKTELDCVIEDIQSGQQQLGGQREDLDEQLTQVTDEIIAKESQLDDLFPQWENLQSEEAEAKRLLNESNTALEALFAKQGRANRFRSKAERDRFLTSEMESLGAFNDSQQHDLQTMKEALATTADLQREIDDKIAQLRTKVNDGKQRIAELSLEHGQLKQRQIVLNEERKDIWREDTKLESLAARALDELRGAERQLASMMDKDTGMGLRAVDNIAERLKLPGVYGPLYRLFEIPDQKYSTAIELTAGNSLFHVVVDTDETASKVLDIMIKEKTGRVTFMPLNRLNPKNPPMPKDDDVIPLLDKLEYDQTYEKAFQQVFGKTCVCRDLTIAAAYVKSHSINTITLEGDKVDRKGALTGGYHDTRRSRIEGIRNVNLWRERYNEASQKSADTKRKVTKVDQEISTLGGQITICVNSQVQVRDARDVWIQEGIALSNERTRLATRKAKLEKDVEELESEIRITSGKIDSYKEELGTPLVQGLTNEEEERIETLGKRVAELQRDLAEKGRSRSEVEGEKNKLEIELSERLRRRQSELQSRLLSLSDGEIDDPHVNDLESKQRDLATLSKSIERLTRKVQDMEKESEQSSAVIADLQRKIDEIQNKQAEDSRAMLKLQKSTERYHAKRQMLTSRKEECNRNIRDLGVLPEEAFEKYTTELVDKLMKKLHKVNDGLKKFAHVNKKAFEQYNGFTKQRDQLLQRRDDLDTSAESIQELVEVLDQRKDEAIERTFKQVAKNFEEVFEALVPAGKGRLIIQKRIDQDEDAEAEADDTQQSSVDNYTGVSIKVSFNSKADEGLRIQQLSGGQKSLVALATVFAIQKCDPAPFYLFDEIDANLDAQYRTAVASMIHSLSESAQFITTTFRPELLGSADKFYGVLFNAQKVSSIKSIKKDEAMQFIEKAVQPQ